MQVQEKTKDEIIKRAEKMSDFLRMEYLENCIKRFNDNEILRYCFLEMAKLYERNVMYSDAIKYLAKYEEVCLTNREKLSAYLKELELLIKAGLYEKIEFSLKKARDISTAKEIPELEQKTYQMLKDEAIKYFKQNKYSPATKAYEKLLSFTQNQEKKIEIKKKLVYLYGKLGRVRDSIELERELDR